MGTSHGKLATQPVVAEDQAIVVDFKKYSKKKFTRYMEAKITHDELQAIRIKRTSVTDKETSLQLEPIKNKIAVLGDLDMKLINTVPFTEIDIEELGKLGVFTVLGIPFPFTSRHIIPYADLDNYYNNVISTISRGLNKYLVPYTENSDELKGTPVDPKTIPIQGPFIQILEYDPIKCEYYVDFMFLKNIEHRQNLRKLPLKAFYQPNDQGTMDLTRVECLDGDVMKTILPPFSMEIHRQINSCMASKNTLLYHVMITHLEVAQSFAYCVRKYLSKNNPMKEYLLHFINGTLRVSSIFIPALLAKSGPAYTSFPYTRNGFNTLLSDITKTFKTDPLRYRKILNPTTDQTYIQLKKDGVKAVTQDDACEIYRIIEKNVDHVLKFMKELRFGSRYTIAELDTFDAEMIQLEAEFKTNCRLLVPGDSLKDILTFALYVGSVTHEIVGNLISDYFINGTYISGSVVDDSKITKPSKQVTGVSESSFFNSMSLLFASIVKGNMLMDIEYVANPDIKQILGKMVNELAAYETVIKNQEITSDAYRVYPSRLEAGVEV